MKLEIGLEPISFLCLKKYRQNAGNKMKNRIIVNKKQVHLAMLDEYLF